MKFLFDFDDFSPKNTNLGILEQIKEHYPNFKVTLFTVPWEIRFGNPTPITEPQYLPFAKALWQARDWIEIAVHGLTHGPEEFLNLTHEEAKKRILVAEKMFINRQIPYAKIFKAPYWQLSGGGKTAAEELGFKVAEDHYYNWNLKDDLPIYPIKWKEQELIIAHGHIQDTTGNGLEENLWKIMRLPTDAKFGFLSEFFEAEKIDPAKIDFRDPLAHIKILDNGKELT